LEEFMKRIEVWLRLGLAAALCVLPVAAMAQQSAIVGAAVAAVPRVVNYSGTLTGLDGKPLTSIVGVPFLLFKDAIGGAPLWMETQNVQPGKNGKYSVNLGSTTNQGLPEDLFLSGEARWLGVRVQGQEEQPRALLVAVPYALKAQDAETINGLPASAFMLAARENGAASGSLGGNRASVLPAAAVTGSGTTGFLPEFTGASTIGNSALFQTGASPTAKLGIDTKAPATPLDVNGAATVRGVFNLPAAGTATAAVGKNSQPELFTASTFNSGTSTAVAQKFQWQAEPAGNDTASPSGTLNLLYGSGTAKPAETGLKISSTGLFTFAAGQTFPGMGSGTITGVLPGTDLTGGGTTGKVTLSLDTTRVPQLAGNNTFTGLQTVKTSSGSAGVTVQNSDASAGFGLEATANTGIKSTGTAYGIQGMTTSGKAGIYGSINGGNTNGGSGYENGSAGVWGDTGGGPGTYIGVLGTANDTNGGVFDNNSQGNFYAALFAQNDTASNPSAAVISTLGSTYDGICNIDVSGNLSCSGTISGSNVAADRRVLSYLRCSRG
jgi:hypothetical protein